MEEQDVFDRIYSLIRGFNSLPPFCKFNLVESLRSNLSVLLPNVDSLTRASQGQDQDNDSLVLERLGSYRNAFKIYSFFLFTVVLAEENNINSSNNTKVHLSQTLVSYFLLFKYLGMSILLHLLYICASSHACVQIVTLNVVVSLSINFFKPFLWFR